MKLIFRPYVIQGRNVWYADEFGWVIVGAVKTCLKYIIDNGKIS